jgi:hypothetical protein
MTTNRKNRDERTIIVENESYKYGYILLTYGILIDIIYRSVRFKEASWDLFALLFVSGLVSTLYQYRQKIFAQHWIRSMLILMGLSAIIAIGITLISSLK